MQLSMNFRSVVVLGLVAGGAYYGYQLFFGGVEGSDLAKLMRDHRKAQPARQAVIKHRIMTLYDRAKDYDTVVRALDSASPTTQALAVEILTARVERRALPRLLEMLSDPARADAVKEALASAMGTLEAREAIPRLVELTDKLEPSGVRQAAHHALVKLTGAGAQVKLGDNTREQWTLWLRQH